MSEEKSTLAKGIEELVNKTIEANKFFLTEGTQIFKQYSNKSGSGENANFIQPDLISNVFNAYLKLNIEHAKNLIDLGVSLVKQSVAKQETETTVPKEEPEEATPAFVLKAETLAGNTITLQFLLDNVKEETVICTLLNSAYIYQNNTAIHQTLETRFLPQAFSLKSTESQTVQIEIITEKSMQPGEYISKVQVLGFEPAFFSIHLTIKEN